MDFVKWLRTQWDRTLAVVLAVAGAVALMLGWLGASESLYPAGQLPYVISGGFTGIFLVGVAAALWISADLRDEWRKLDETVEELAAVRQLLEDDAVSRNGHVHADTPANDTPPARRRRQLTKASA